MSANSDAAGAEHEITVNVQRGFLRLAFGAALLWFIFWTFAYVLGSPRFDTGALAPPALSLTTKIVLTIAAVLLAPWIVSGFRSDS